MSMSSSKQHSLSCQVDMTDGWFGLDQRAYKYLDCWIGLEFGFGMELELDGWLG